MAKKVQTTKITGGAEYAKVADRLKMFREECTQGSIETLGDIKDGYIIFKTTIIKDLSNEFSARATGTAMQKMDEKTKAFEKTESISVGRALAMLGYFASGEIASSEEMEEFQDYKETKRVEEELLYKEQIDNIETLEALQAYYFANKGRGKEFDSYVMARKSELNKIKTVTI